MATRTLDDEILVVIEFANRICEIFEKEIGPHIEKKDIDSMLPGLKHFKAKLDMIRKINFDEMVNAVREFQSAGRELNQLQTPEIETSNSSQPIQEDTEIEVEPIRSQATKRKKGKGKKTPKKTPSY